MHRDNGIGFLLPVGTVLQPAERFGSSRGSFFMR